ncbi:MAG TPA: hypothetical protein VFE58_14445 [Tepidisphaeraceae bacterium]|nr:hypothetical protein [Tepidisphaeraceae bacterium]
MHQRHSPNQAMLVAALLISAAVVHQVLRFVARPRRRPNPAPSSASLHHSILGADKQMVQAVFGPPKAAAGLPIIPPAGRQAYWEASTWYYPVHPIRRTALAIRFQDGVAQKVDFVQG